jgi:hypothetical protein
MAHDAAFVARIRNLRDGMLGLICDGNVGATDMEPEDGCLWIYKTSRSPHSRLPGKNTARKRNRATPAVLNE